MQRFLASRTLATPRLPLLLRHSSTSTQSKLALFDKILIANRGEIACRVIRTAKKLGIKTVAVYSDADQNAMHVKMADEAYRLGPPPASESYLRKDLIIDIAKHSGAQAIHPGYGFLSENSDFCIACANAGIEFIGPPVKAIVAMGSKSASKDIMLKAKVPVTPGYHGEDQSIDTLQREADKMGYPLICKAVMGGGGKGMRIVYSSEEFREAVESCQREAKSSFGNTRVLFERFLTKPRHIEFQIFADKHGNAVHLFERDCSTQRRHQKVLEEATAPHMSHELRKKMGDAAVAAAKAVGYVGAGTVEFMLDEDESFYFMEMNTRLQVEHPVTEMITGQDLVEWQLKVAAGEKLPLTQEELYDVAGGHAIEARIYAENPYKDFLPGTGTLSFMETPEPSEVVRVETGVRQGDEVSIFYDPMIAKLIVKADTRLEAISLLKNALNEFRIVGLTTNIEFLRRTLTHPRFLEGTITTNFLDEEGDPLTTPFGKVPTSGLALTALGQLLRDSKQAKKHATAEVWAADTLESFRVNHNLSTKLSFFDGGEEVVIGAEYLGDGHYKLTIPGEEEALLAKGTLSDDGTLVARIGSHNYEGKLVAHKDSLYMFANDTDLRHFYKLDLPKPTFGDAAGASGKPTIVTPMPGRIVKILVSPGQKVKKDQTMIIMEAMKMEHAVRAPSNGKVGEFFVAEGSQVPDGKVLVELES